MEDSKTAVVAQESQAEPAPQESVATEPVSPQSATEPPSRRPLADVLSEYDPREVQQHVQRDWTRRESELRQRWERETKSKAEEDARANFLKTGNPEDVGRWIQEQEKFKEAVANHGTRLGEQYSTVISNLFTDLFRNAQPVLNLLPRNEAAELYEQWTNVGQLGIEKGIPLFNKQFLMKLEGAVRADERKKANAEFEKEKVALKTSWETERNAERANPDLSRGAIVPGDSYEEVMSWPMPKRAQWEQEHPEQARQLYGAVLSRNGR